MSLDYLKKHGNCIQHPASKSLEGFLRKLISRKRLYENKQHSIGQVFGENSRVIKDKIKNKKLIAKTKAAWDFCRNDVMHYQRGREYKYGYMKKRYEEIIEVMILLYEDFYGKTERDKEIKDGLEKHVFLKYNGKKIELSRN